MDAFIGCLTIDDLKKIKKSTEYLSKKHDVFGVVSIEVDTEKSILKFKFCCSDNKDLDRKVLFEREI